MRLYIAQILLLAGLYFIAGQASFSLSVSHAIVTQVVFAAEGFALAAAILLGARVWPGVFLGQLALALHNGLAWELALGVSAVNSLEAIIGAALFRRLRLRPGLETMRDVAGLLLLVFLVLQPFSATLGNLLLWLGGVVPTAYLIASWFSWWFGNALGQVLVTPLLLSFFSCRKNVGQRLRQTPWLKLFAIPAGIILFAATVSSSLAVAFASLPLLILIAATGGMVAANLATAIIAVAILFLTQQMKGAFVHNDAILLLNLNIYLLSMALAGQFISALLAEYRQARVAQQEALENLQKSEARLRAIIDISPVPLTLNDGQQNITFLNPTFTQTFGYELSDIPTLDDWWTKAYPDPKYRQWVMDTWKAALAQAEREGKTFTPLERTVFCKNGAQKTILASAAVISQSFDDTHLVMLYDITERKRAETEMRIAAIVFESQVGMLVTDANATILKVNQAFCRITGYSTDEVIGQNPNLLYSGRHDKAFYAELWRCLHQTGIWAGEIWNRRKNGQIYPEWLTITAVRDNRGEITHYVATFTDITERKATEEYIQQLAFYDPLTQLPNRRLLQERLKHGISASHRTGSEMAVLMLDLDRFKAVNDSLGHAAGDELLAQAAGRVKARLREADTVARLGGDEFVVLLEGVGRAQAASVATDIIHALSQPFTLCQSHPAQIGVSIGISLYPQDGDSVESLMDNADAALYRAKNQGRGCFAYYGAEDPV